MHPHPDSPAAALQSIADAAAAAEIAKRTATASEYEAARCALQSAVDAARLIGIGWTKIGETLGIRRGNAYQRYRRPPPTTRQETSTSGTG